MPRFLPFLTGWFDSNFHKIQQMKLSLRKNEWIYALETRNARQKAGIDSERAIDHFLALHLVGRLLGLFPLAAPGSFSPQGSLALGSWHPRLCARRFLCLDWVVAEYFARKLNNAGLLSFDGKRVTRTDDVHVRRYQIPPRTTRQ